MVGCVLFATLHSKCRWGNLTAILQSFKQSFFFLTVAYYVLNAFRRFWVNQSCCSPYDSEQNLHSSINFSWPFVIDTPKILLYVFGLEWKRSLVLSDQSPKNTCILKNISEKLYIQLCIIVHLYLVASVRIA